MTEKEKVYFEKIFAKNQGPPTILVRKEAVILDKQDQNLEQQVWQRVRSCREEGSKNDLRQMQREALELAALYRSLAGQLTGKAREQALQLHRGEKANAAALTGIAMVSRRNGENLKLWQPGKEDPKKLLERCYHRSRRCMTEYLSRSPDGEFGVVFDQMARREGQHCLMILQLLGGIL